MSLTAEQDFQNLCGKLWIYTNYDCNLRCSYCLAESSPGAEQRALSLAAVQEIVDEAVSLGFEAVHFTGGEPLLHKDLFAMLAYTTERLPAVLLTNAMLLHGKRLEALKSLPRQRLTLQISLDGGSPGPHDAWRGAGSWQKTVDGIRAAQQAGFHIKLSTTETPANSEHLAEICAFHHSLGIAEEDHFIRPLARRGFAASGVDVGKDTLAPELTVGVDGLYWHPLSTDPDLQVSAGRVPLAQGLACIQQTLAGFHSQRQDTPKTFQ